MAGKEALLTGKLTFDSVQYGVTDMSVTRTFDEIDTTDTETTAGEKEFIVGRQTTEFSITVFMHTDVADLVTGVSKVMTIDFEGKTYAGNGILMQLVSEATINNAIKQTYTGKITGTVTVTPEA